ncbi:efflux RND transporter periplasmic adaptor subunit [Henriciella sp.]|jgi:Cu(I)/Ag(I) efflux system membrane fusion protein|uniref:efflux RND transporter periplasmic adaptor subunit n=1 Tax=Henriciella sp. TaxID=1968823 RepID=UPI00261F2414|nr:efflux RND transporter periplasmic adaptor subunit [Henriciella sp.]
MKKTFLIMGTASAALLLAACGAPGGSPGGQGEKPNASSETQRYTCPMHPHYISTDPDGTCPICGMDLVPADKTQEPTSSTGEILYYKHPMGKPDTSPVPKKDSMGMDYIPVYADDTGSGVAVSPEMIQTMGIRTSPAETRDFSRVLRAFGTVETNERLENVTVSRLEGWIENLAVNAEGDTVRPGSLLYRIYSPDLIAAQKDYLNSFRIGNEARIASVRQRLRSLGMQNAAIDRLTETRQVIERVPVYAEAGGTVAELQVRNGDYVKPGTPILRLQSYADVWVIASVPESDLPLVETGMQAELDFPSAPDAPGKGQVDYIYPTIDPKTRTADVRIEVDNVSGYLRPGAYADIRLNIGGRPRLSVPSEAILLGSEGARVVIAEGNGRFSGRAVQTGISANGRTEILSGLESGDMVVASGQFLLDSEANLKEGLAKLEAPDASAASPETPLSDIPVDSKALAEIDHFTDMALYFHEALRDGYDIDPLFVDPALALVPVLRDRYANTKLAPVMDATQTALAAAQDVTDREDLATQLSDLVEALKPWLLEGAPQHYSEAGLVLYRDTATGRYWLQEEAKPANPYSADGAERIDWPNPMAGMSMTTNDGETGADQAPGHSGDSHD